MNRVIREHYPIESLPDDLRRDLPATGRVSVAITLESDAELPIGQFSRFRDRCRRGFASPAEIDAHLAALRDEWDRP